MSNTAVDRRILKAFYTQYVAVLLIVLVFGIWMFQSSSVQSSARSQVSAAMPSYPPVGQLQIKDLFDVGATVSIRSSVELEAIAEILRNHDLRATFRLSGALEESQAERAAETMLARLKALRSFFQTEGVPAEAITVATGSEFSDRSLTMVSFEFVGRARESR
jgi:hypothetical protein